MERWRQYWDAYQELGTFVAVAKKFGVAHTSVSRALHSAARAGKINLTDYENPPGFVTTKSTLQVNAAGEIEREWRRVAPQSADFEEWVDSLCDKAGRAGPKIKPAKRKGATALEIPIGDMHMGMYSWAKETGANWDTRRACTIFTRGVTTLIDQAEKSTSHLILADLGDFLHSDNRFGTTEASGNILDMDSRFTDVIDRSRDAWIAVIERAIPRFRSVYVIMTPGNHNTHSAHWMARVIAAYFRNCPSVTIDVTPTMHRYHRWEQSLFGYSHGHLIKANKLASEMATGAKRHWADTTHHHWRCGHIHHGTKDIYKDSDEDHGVTVEYFPILPPGDAYHVEKGYKSRRLIQGILHHKTDGEVVRHTVHARQLLT